MSKYQGWANYETWNVALWLGNEYSYYKAALACAKRHGGKVTAGEAEEFVRGLMPEGTPDFADKGKAEVYSRVYWPDIADDINEMAGG